MKRKINVNWLLVLVGVLLLVGLGLLFKFGLVGQSWLWTPRGSERNSDISLCEKQLLEATYGKPSGVEPFYVHGTYPEIFYECRSYYDWGFGVFRVEEFQGSSDVVLQERLMQEVEIHSEISSKLNYCPSNELSLARLYGVGACKVSVPVVTGDVVVVESVDDSGFGGFLVGSWWKLGLVVLLVGVGVFFVFWRRD